MVQFERSLLFLRADVCHACDSEAICAGFPDGAAKLCCCMCKKRGIVCVHGEKSTLKRNGLLLLIGILVFKFQLAPFRQMSVSRLETSLYW